MKRARTTGAGYQAKLPTPFALLGIRTVGGELAEITFLPNSGGALAPRDRLAAQACAQIERYLEDPEFRFDLPLASQGTPFQRRVWRKIAAIGTGRTRSYGEIARELGSSPRAVGQACGANPVPLVVPCHRVLAAGGLGGFAHHEGGFHLSVKRWLLAHEGAARR
jgi:methylated-DNA-[protein]-cysteine S-methyltransferase